MQKIIILAILGIVLASNAMAASYKICFPANRNEDIKGVVLAAEIDFHEIKIKTIRGDFYNGAFSTRNTSVRGNDGQVYLEYMNANSEDQDLIIVEQELLRSMARGIIQFKASDDGSSPATFKCKDDN